MPILHPSMKDYLSKHISDVCNSEYNNDKINHCAHFVSHVLGYQFGFTCKDMTGKGDEGVCIRVHELFSRCPKIGYWKDLVEKEKNHLVFITDASNVNIATKTMRNIPKKHVGIYSDKHIYHYSNSKDKVVKQTPEQFSKHYRGNNITMYYGTLPMAATKS